MKDNKPKILVFDIETAPLLSWNWGKFEQNAIAIEKDYFIISFAAKWLDSKKIISYNLSDFKSSRKNKQDDKELCQELWKLFEEADVLIAHNGFKFDVKKTNTRFIHHDLMPPSPYKIIDTLLIAKKYFSFTSNSLNDLGKQFNIGNKIKHEGIGLWFKCMSGDKASFKRMKRYNIQDVVLLEKLYKKLLPWITSHPNYNVYNQTQHCCPNCGNSKVQKRGFYYTRVSKFQRFQCQNCGAWSSSRLSEKGGKPDLK